jgi:hypothetical protein
MGRKERSLDENLDVETKGPYARRGDSSLSGLAWLLLCGFQLDQ